jgi:hypothetical protein
MADFLSDIGSAFGQSLTNRFNNATSAFTDPEQTFVNRVNTSLGVNTSTQATPVTAPVNPQMGPTIEASQGLQPNNPLNNPKGAPIAPAQPPAPILDSNQINPTTVSAPINPAANQVQPTQLPKTGPAQPGANYLQQVGQQESGNNPNIGYHYPANAQGQRTSSAFGQYGITSGAYQDIQKADPYFAGKAITELTPEDQNRAAQVYTGLNGKQLQNLGVDSNPTNLRLAHFLGATGAANYLNNGTISPAAAQANGGEAKVRHIIDSIVKGTAQNVSAPPAPAAAVVPGQQPSSAPAEQAPSTAFTGQGITMPGGFTQQHLEDLNGSDPNKIKNLAFGLGTPPAVQSAAFDKLYDSATVARKMAQVQQKVETDIANNKMPNLNARGEEGSYIKAYLFKRLGLDDLAKQEQQKISPELHYSPVLLDNGEHYQVKFDKNSNQVLGAWDSEGAPVSDSKKLGQIAAMSINPKNAAQHAQVFADPTGAVKGTFVLETRNGGQPVYKRVGGGSDATPAEAAVLKAQGVQGSLEYQAMQQNQKNQGKLETLKRELDIRLSMLPAQEHNKYISKFNAENGTTFPLMAAPGMPANTAAPGATATPGAPAMAAPAAGGAPAATSGAPAATSGTPGAPAMAAPAAGVAPAATSGAPGAVTAPGTVPGATAMRPASEFANPAAYEAYKKAKAQQDKDLANGVAKVQLALPQYESNAEQLLDTVHSLVGTEKNPAPGFEENVGVKGWKQGFGAWNPLPGTEGRGWQAKYQQLMGQEFLDAFAQLRGAGAISNQEGQTATKARAALSDPGISEADFRKNAKILEDTVMKGVNRQRELAGLPPKYDLSTGQVIQSNAPSAPSGGIKIIKREKIQ